MKITGQLTPRSRRGRITASSMSMYSICEPMVNGLNKRHCICDVKGKKSEGHGVRSPAFLLAAFADLWVLL